MANKSLSVIYGARTSGIANPQIEGDALWLTGDELERASGWVFKPQGFCKAETCIPVPPGRPAEFIRGSRYNLAALAELLGQPIVRNQEHAVWCFGEAAAERKRSLTSLNAPGFTLPDLSGRMHSLSEHIGKKILLVSWASW
jgi:hypothetical protein